MDSNIKNWLCPYFEICAVGTVRNLMDRQRADGVKEEWEKTFCKTIAEEPNFPNCIHHQLKLIEGGEPTVGTAISTSAQS